MPHRPPSHSRSTTRRTAAGLAALALAGGALLVPTAPAAAAPAPADLAGLVNPFVGTESEGNAYPGATVPFGMVQLSPDNTDSYQSTSYSNEAGRVWGFSHRHINSAGCPAAGEVLVTPTVSAEPQTVREFQSIEPGTETAEAGYYAATLEGDVRAELTATERTGVHRYTFPATDTANVSFNLGETLRDAGASSVTWVDDRTLEGWVDNGGFCGGTTESRYFFSAQFDRAPETRGTWNADGAFVPDSATSESDGGANGAAAVFDATADQDVEIGVGVSYVDLDGARANRVAELGADGTAFDAVRDGAQAAWNDQLGAIRITASPDAQRVFYTQLYKALLSPTIGSDVDGRYRGMDLEVHEADGWTYHQTFSLWDTYRSQATLHGLIAHDRAKDIVRSMYQHRVQGGWLPRWSLGPVETNIMAGDPASAWVAENFTLGTVPADIEDELWNVLVENATTAPPETVDSVGRQSAEFWLENGHIPYYPENEPGLGQQFEEYRHGGSSSMEFAISDAAIGAAAQRMGRDDEAAPFLERGRNWQRLWNPEVELSGGFTGIVNAVTPEGEFVATEELTPVQESGFHESTGWQYQWMANQDFAGLQEVMGGTEAMIERLDYYFAMDDLRAEPGVSPEHWAPGGSTYYTSIGYNPGNEPTIMNPWLYSAVGQPDKVNDVLAANLNRFPDTPGGGVGNDDLGTLASWYVMASLGVAPVVPGSGMFALNAPRVEQATVALESGAELEITASGAHESLPRYISALTVDGEPTTRTWVDLDQLADGGSLAFELTDEPGGDWGTAVEDRLPSVSAPVRTGIEISPEAATTVAGSTEPLDVASVAFSDADAAALPISGTLEVDGESRALDARLEDDAWVLSATGGWDEVGVVDGTVTVTPATETPEFAPDPFEAASAVVEITVEAAAVEPEPEPEPTDPAPAPEPTDTAVPGPIEPDPSVPDDAAPTPVVPEPTVPEPSVPGPDAPDAGSDTGTDDGSAPGTDLAETGSDVAPALSIAGGAVIVLVFGLLMAMRARRQRD